MSRDELIALIRRCDPIAAAAALPPAGEVTVARGGPPAEFLVDGDVERPIDEHRQAHRAGRPSEATVIYGEGVDPERIADRLIGLARLADETGLLRAVCPVPATGTLTPGSWGVEDLTIIAAARRVLGPSVRVRRAGAVGPQTCGVTLAFGADDLAVPKGDFTDVGLLAEAVGRQAVER